MQEKKFFKFSDEKFSDLIGQSGQSFFLPQHRCLTNDCIASQLLRQLLQREGQFYRNGEKGSHRREKDDRWPLLISYPSKLRAFVLFDIWPKITSAPRIKDQLLMPNRPSNARVVPERSSAAPGSDASSRNTDFFRRSAKKLTISNCINDLLIWSPLITLLYFFEIFLKKPQKF